MNPHLFRDCAVYTVANLAGAEMGIASALLQHADPRITEKHYNKGASFVAARDYQQMLMELESSREDDLLIDRDLAQEGEDEAVRKQARRGGPIAKRRRLCSAKRRNIGVTDVRE